MPGILGFPASKDLLVSVAAGLSPPVIRLLARTWSFRIANRGNYERYVLGGGPVVAVLWHQMVIPGVAFFRDMGIVIMVSRSRDGEMIARAAERLGFLTVRGSSSRGGSEALHELLGAVRRGRKTAITVDGPRGPAREAKGGAVAAARCTGAPVLPIACRARPAVYAGSWDRTMIPLPFARVAVAIGDPIVVPEDIPEEECERYRIEIGRAIDRAEHEAAGMLGV